MTNEMVRDIVIGTIGPGAANAAIEWCIKDLLEHHYKLWHHSLNHYRHLYGYTTEGDMSTTTVGLFPVINC